MSRLDKAIDGLKKWIHYDDVVLVREQLKTIKKERFNGDYAQLRAQLNTLLQDRKEQCFQAAFDGLLALAKAAPLNQTDPISLEPITRNNRVVSSKGYQYDLNCLIRFHNNRARRAGDFEKKQLIDPLTNTPFAQDDADYIFEKAKERGLIQVRKKPEAAKINYVNHTRFFMPPPVIAPFPFPVFGFEPFIRFK